jgi:hypothetical protein
MLENDRRDSSGYELTLAYSDRRGTQWAWVLSAILHAALFVSLSLIWSQDHAGLIGSEESERTVSLAVARQHGAKVEYEPAPPDATSPDAAALSGAPTVADDPLPPAGQPESLPLPRALNLPLPGVSGAPGGVLTAPRTTPSAAVRIPSRNDYSKLIAEESARLQALQPKGDPVTMSLFDGPPAHGRSFVFVLDRSKSMGSGGLNALAAAQIELSRALSALQPVHRFTVIAYHHQPAYLQGRQLLPATPQNCQQVATFFAGLAAFGQTHHDVGLRAALLLDPDVVYLFTDGGDPYLTEPEILTISRDAARQRTAIHCIQFGFGPLRDRNHFLVRLAAANAGGYTYVDMSNAPWPDR